MRTVLPKSVSHLAAQIAPYKVGAENRLQPNGNSTQLLSVGAAVAASDGHVQNGLDIYNEGTGAKPVARGIRICS